MKIVQITRGQSESRIIINVIVRMCDWGIVSPIKVCGGECEARQCRVKKCNNLTIDLLENIEYIFNLIFPFLHMSMSRPIEAFS